MFSFLLALFVLINSNTAPGAAADPPADRIQVERDDETLRTTIRIALDGGRVSWSDVARGLARARGFDDDVLAGVLPPGQLDLASARWRWTRVGLNLALAPHVRFDVTRPDDDGVRQLAIQLDEAALLASRRRFKQMIQRGLTRVLPGRGATYGLTLDEDWQAAGDGKRLVLFVHGFQSNARHAEGLLQVLRSRGLPCGVFDYPNDQPIAKSARILARDLARLADDHPRVRVTLLAHSMGGLVSRAVIEDPGLDPGNVTRLVMVATPNYGSQLARFAFALEVWEFVRNGDERDTVERFYGSIEDGLSEASVDLRPDSVFLRELNGRSRNPDVRYTLILGTGAPLSEADVERLRTSFRLAGDRSRWVRFFGPRVNEWLADLDDVIAGRGDGVVAVKRGRLPGVADTVVLDFDHTGLMKVTHTAPLPPLHEVVLDRLDDTPGDGP
jgi:pimeloyl-ACP methyl ester carboxylesterase